jgi:uncharacterized protein YfaT (DUF1175 family)
MRRGAALPVLAALLLGPLAAFPGAQLRLADAGDRQTLRSWFVLLADAAFYRPPAEVTDCAALVRYALRESLRPHTPEWLRHAGLPVAPGLGDVRGRPEARNGMLPLFRIADGDDAVAEFADAKTIVRWNTRRIARDAAAARPGDLLYYRQPSQRQPDHLMIVVGPSRLDETAPDFVVYHTGPDGSDPGEIRKVRLADLLRHPAPRWRPIPANEAFVGVFRLAAFP